MADDDRRCLAAIHERKDSELSKERDNTCLRADRLVNSDRGAVYGHPHDDFSRTAAMWSALLGIDVTPDQVAKCMIAVKLSRLTSTPNHRDSVDDIAGYALTLEMVLDRQEDR